MICWFSLFRSRFDAGFLSSHSERITKRPAQSFLAQSGAARGASFGRRGPVSAPRAPGRNPFGARRGERASRTASGAAPLVDRGMRLRRGGGAGGGVTGARGPLPALRRGQPPTDQPSRHRLPPGPPGPPGPDTQNGRANGCKGDADRLPGTAQPLEPPPPPPRSRHTTAVDSHDRKRREKYVSVMYYCRNEIILVRFFMLPLKWI